METPDAQQQMPSAGAKPVQPPVYSAVFTGVCLCMALVTYSAIAPGWPLGICLLAVLAVGIISFVITIIALCIFECMSIPGWGKYLLLLCIVTQWHLPLSLLTPYSAQNSLSVMVMGGLAYFTWPVVGVYMARHFGPGRPWFASVCWALSAVLLLACFTSVFR